jgi:hypothetical protein
LLFELASTLEKLVGTLVKFEDCAIYSGQYKLKFGIVFESLLIAIETRKGIADICICIEQRLEYISMLTCELVLALDITKEGAIGK